MDWHFIDIHFVLQVKTIKCFPNKENAKVTGCQLFYRKIYGNFYSAIDVKQLHNQTLFMPRSAASETGLHCLHNDPKGVSGLKWTKQ